MPAASLLIARKDTSTGAMTSCILPHAPIMETNTAGQDGLGGETRWRGISDALCRWHCDAGDSLRGMALGQTRDANGGVHATRHFCTPAWGKACECPGLTMSPTRRGSTLLQL